MSVTTLPVTADLVGLNLLFNQGDSFTAPLPECLCIFQSDHAGQIAHFSSVTINDLTAVTAGGAITDLGGFDKCYAMLLLCQRQCSTDSAQSATNDAGFHFNSAF